MKKLFVVSVLFGLLGCCFGCNNYNYSTGPEWKSLDQDMVTADQVYRYELGEVIKKNRVYYERDVSDKLYSIKPGSCKELKEKCSGLYSALKKKYSGQELQVEDILKNKFSQVYFEGVIEYLDDEMLSYKHVGSQPIAEFIDTNSISKVGSKENLWFTFMIEKLTENKAKMRFYYRDNANRINLGKEIITVEFNGNLLFIKRSQHSEIAIIDIDKFYNFIVNNLGKDERFYDVYFNEALDNRLSEATKKIEAEFQKYNQRASLLHQINNNDLRCLIIKKNLSFFEDKNDLSISKIQMVQYKNNRYLTINVIYLNVFNNINIKFNDQYKITRYLYDQLIRKGIREFSDTYEISDIDGLCFKILATDKNFIDDKGTSNFSAYEFYMPKKECLLYINDDITGQDLASSSYILVNGERIELR